MKGERMRRKTNSESFWPSISDLMAGLMMVFLFVAVSFMLEINNQKESMENLVAKYKLGKLDLYESLVEEFDEDLDRWDATIDKETLSIRFNEPEILFSRGSANINEKFKALLDDFFPRYIQILSSPRYKGEIEEIRIEGHTSSEWATWSTKMGSYYSNMELSQARTRNTLKYVMEQPESKKKEEFLIDKLTANGLSFSKRIVVDGREDGKASRRVEFKVRTKAEKYLDEMFRQVKINNNVEVEYEPNRDNKGLEEELNDLFDQIDN